MSPDLHRQNASARLRAQGVRVTSARVQVLALLTAADQALSHHQLEERLEPGVMDRVTLYRVLDWLVEQGLAHRVAGADRVFRFAVLAEGAVEHPHFECRRCGRTLCLAQGTVSGMQIPEGYQIEQTEITVRGVCSECGASGVQAAMAAG